jgi:dTDP-4-dehydrorhamnose reductase
MKVLITGRNGLLGSFLFERLKKDGIECCGLERAVFVELCLDRKIQFLGGYDVIVHAAASTSVEKNELYAAEAYRDNVGLTLDLAIACREAKCRLIYISSTGVYGDSANIVSYSELDPIYPTTVHHRCKSIGESICRDLVPNSIILRLGWLFGAPDFSGGGFVASIVKEALACSENNRPLKTNGTQLGSPTSVLDVVSVISVLLKDDFTGTYNMVSGGVVSRSEYVRQICIAANISVKIEQVNPEYFGRIAPVSLNEGASSEILCKLLGVKFPDWRDSLAKICA